MTAPLWWNVAFDEPLPVFIETTTGVSSQAILSSHPGAYAIKGPWLVESDATAWLTKNAKPAFGGHGTWPPAPPGSPPGGGGGSPAPPPPSGGGSGSKVPVPGKLATFGQWKDWIDSRAPGEGDTWIAWVESHAKITPPESDTVDLSGNQFPAGGTFLKGNTGSNYASNWFAAWILLGNVGPDIAKLLAGAISTTAGKIPGVLKDVGAGIGQVPGAQALSGLDAIGGFFSELGQANTWIRVGEVLLGIILIGIGIARITGAGNAISSAVKNIKVLPV